MFQISVAKMNRENISKIKGAEIQKITLAGLPFTSFCFSTVMCWQDTHIVNVYDNNTFKGQLHLWKDECVYKMGQLC